MSSSEETESKQKLIYANKYYSLKNSRLTLNKLSKKPYRINQSYLHPKISSKQNDNKISFQLASFDGYQGTKPFQSQQRCSTKLNIKRTKANDLIGISNKCLKGYSISIIQKTLHQSLRGLKREEKDINALNSSKFVYYISQVMRDVEKNKFFDEQSNFLDHFMLCMYTIKENRFNFIPKEPRNVINVKKLGHIQDSKFMKKTMQKKLLIFDLDETLIHCVREQNRSGQKYPYQKQIRVPYNNYSTNKFKDKPNLLFNRENHSKQDLRAQFNYFLIQEEYKQKDILKVSAKLTINLRPFVKEVLSRLSDNFILAVFTAAEENYAKQIVQILDPSSNIFSFCLSRNYCTAFSSASLSDDKKISRSYIKDIRIINSIDMSQVLLIDNSPTSYLFQCQNGIPIIPFIDDHQDDQLLKLQNFLYEHILHCKDVRSVVTQIFGPQYYQDSRSVKQVLKKIDISKYSK